MEVYVDENGIAHDDEGNSWPTNRSEGHYSHRDFLPKKRTKFPRKKKQQPKPEIKQEG